MMFLIFLYLSFIKWINKCFYLLSDIKIFSDDYFIFHVINQTIYDGSPNVNWYDIS